MRNTCIEVLTCMRIAIRTVCSLFGLLLRVLCVFVLVSVVHILFIAVGRNYYVVFFSPFVSFRCGRYHSISRIRSQLFLWPSTRMFSPIMSSSSSFVHPSFSFFFSCNIFLNNIRPHANVLFFVKKNEFI